MKTCPICNANTLRCEVQPPLLAHLKPIPLATCDNPACKMCGFTIREDRYSDTEYLTSMGYLKK